MKNRKNPSEIVFAPRLCLSCHYAEVISWLLSEIENEGLANATLSEICDHLWTARRPSGVKTVGRAAFFDRMTPIVSSVIKTYTANNAQKKNRKGY